MAPRSTETEVSEAAFREGRARIDETIAGLRARLEVMAPVNVADGLGRLPVVIARILRRLDQAGLLGQQVVVVGTNALFAYEAEAGVQFESGLLATGDIDLALDVRRRLTLASSVLPRGLMGVLEQIDPSFRRRGPGDFRAYNKDGLMVDLITPMTRNIARDPPRRLGEAREDDLIAAALPKLQWLVEAPRFAATVIDERGLPATLVAADPRFFAAHKFWLAGREDRESLKGARDLAQAQAVARLTASSFPRLSFDDRALSPLPPELRQGLREMVAAAPVAAAEW